MTFEEIKNRLKTKTVGIAGCGGLGSNCAVALARTGIGKIIIADFDVIVMNNLNRQYYFYNQLGYKKVHALKENIRMVNPEVQVVPYDLKLTPAEIVNIFKDCDVIVEAFDLADMKQMIIETVQVEMPGKPLVVGLGMAGFGKNDLLGTRRIDNLYICGDGISEISDSLPPIAPRVGIVAHMQANQVLEILLNQQ
jgi:sulfur carrier protein ThiS adenylyltransferase